MNSLHLYNSTPWGQNYFYKETTSLFLKASDFPDSTFPEKKFKELSSGPRDERWVQDTLKGYFPGTLVCYCHHQERWIAFLSDQLTIIFIKYSSHMDFLSIIQEYTSKKEFVCLYPSSNETDLSNSFENLVINSKQEAFL